MILVMLTSCTPLKHWTILSSSSDIPLAEKAWKYEGLSISCNGAPTENHTKAIEFE
jgi:hypothetical protein